MFVGTAGESAGWHALVAEAKLAMELEHPNVVKYLGIGHREEERYVLMELAEGGSVRSELDEIEANSTAAGRGIDLARVRVLTRQVLGGVCYLHARGVMHRDIKCANLLYRDSARECAMLGDFGSSTALGGLDKSSMHSLHGTPFWMAPEVISGAAYGRKADVWSVGGVVLEMLTGSPPWSTPEREGLHMNFFTVMCRIVTSKVPPPMPEWLPADARDFLLRCFERDTDARPTALALLVHPFLAGCSS
ncbi:kinase-like domain-containing protein [Pavlovales sp. CCMP2436]|nr:kinase-like domain-containing protein [Pavlovales sp. CCMP2436]